MKILAIETSCDETAVAVLEAEGEIENPSFCVLGNALYSQSSKHAKHGGVYPTLAKREHSKNLVPLLKNVLNESGLFISGKSIITKDIEKVLRRESELLKQLIKLSPNIGRPDIDAIAVTQGPGLEPALWVGINFAKALSQMWNIPFIPVNHMEGHVLSVMMKKDVEVIFPALALLVSGGHTELVLMKDWMQYKVIGQTLDDAVGEAFDKVARMLGLPYPGGPKISSLATLARERAGGEKKLDIKLPRPMINTDDYDFSYSGLKTAVLYFVKDLDLTDEQRQDVAKEFEDAAIEVLVKKTEKATAEFGIKTLIAGGGVIANKYLRAELAKIKGVNLLVPSIELSTDNAVMIGVAGYFRHLAGDNAPMELVGADGKLRLD